MRSIEKSACSAFTLRRKFKRANTEVDVIAGRVVLFLHGYPIAAQSADPASPDASFNITLASYPTATTRSRLNALLSYMNCSARVRQRKGQQVIQMPGSPDMPIYSCDVVRVFSNRVEVI